AELHAAKPARGGIRYSGRHVERPLGNCISLGNGNGILVQPGKSRNGTGEVPGIPEDYAAGVDRRWPRKHFGKFYTYRFLNPWPRPYQKPHPPCYIVGAGSPETIEFAAELGFGYSSVFVPQQVALQLNQKLRERAAH